MNEPQAPVVASNALLAARIRSLMGPYGGKMQQAMILRYAYGMGDADILAIMGCTKGALKQYEARGRGYIEYNWPPRVAREILTTGGATREGKWYPYPLTANPKVRGPRTDEPERIDQ